jgi:hypothetical protein
MTTEPKRLWYPECDITAVEEDDQMRHGNAAFFDRYVGKLYQEQSCPYCGSRVAQLPVQDGRYSEYYRSYYLPHQSSVRSLVFSCPECQWWALHESGWGYSETYHWVTGDDSIHWGKIKEFDVAEAALPVDALRRHLSERGASLPAWPPTALAQLVSACFSDFFACEAIPVGGPGDAGIDVILLDAEQPLILEVQRSADPASGKSVQVVTELLGMALWLERCDGIVVSTANRYRFPSKKKALRGTSMMDMGHRIKLYNDAIVVDVLARTLTPTAQPWANFLR